MAKEERLYLSDHFGRDPFCHEGLDRIADLDVAVIRDRDAAFHAVANLTGVVLEALQGCDLALEDDHIIAQQAHFGIALDETIDYLATGHGSYSRDAEGIADFCSPLICLLDGGLEQAAHSTLDLVLQFINDRVQADIDFLLVGEFLR